MTIARLSSAPDVLAELYIGDYFSDTMHFSADEHRAFRLLLLHIWLNGRLPRFKRSWAAIGQASSADWRAMRNTLAPLLTVAVKNIATWKQAVRRYDGQRLPAAEWHIIRTIVLERDGWTCTYCGSGKRLHVDHKVAVSRGGSNLFDNLTTSCAPCNLSKGPKTLEEWDGHAS